MTWSHCTYIASLSFYFISGGSSVFSENVARLKSSLLGASSGRDLSMFAHVQAIVSGELGLVILSVLLLHSAGFFVG